MIEFNTGERVQYSTSGGLYPNYGFAGLTGTVKPTPHNRTGVSVLWDNGTTGRHAPRYLIPLKGLVLPPAPESVMYFNSNAQPGNDQRLSVQGREDPTGEDCLFVAVKIRTGSNYNHVIDFNRYGIGVNLDADAALQLASDLTRMAMELKRKGK